LSRQGFCLRVPPMANIMKNFARAAVVVSGLALAGATLRGQQPPAERPKEPDGFRFKTGVELVNVTATVSDAGGRFVSGLRQEDFVVYEDDELQTVTHFSAERVPVSLGLVLDTSGSMAGDKIDAARGALNRFLYDLLDRNDEVFLYRFSDYPVLVQGWTRDRGRLSNAISRIAPTGGTAMYDAVAEALPLAARGMNQKKAIVVISDGNDTSSQTGIRDLKQLIRQSEVLVYAVGIDGEDEGVQQPPTYRVPPRPRFPTPLPFPPPRGRFSAVFGAQIFGGGRTPARGDHVNVAALRDLTDDSGGRTEIVRDPRDLDPATAGIADELSKQYYLGYTSTEKKDGQWHAIRVEVRGGNYHVRARRGYFAN
jgi:Ca-activated chloride channel family protein